MHIYMYIYILIISYTYTISLIDSKCVLYVCIRYVCINVCIYVRMYVSIYVCPYTSTSHRLWYSGLRPHTLVAYTYRIHPICMCMGSEATILVA